MIDIDVLLKLWPIILAVVLTVAWFIRLEAKVESIKTKQISLDSDHDKLEEKMWTRFDAIHKMFSEISTKLTRVETIIEERTKDGHL